MRSALALLALLLGQGCCYLGVSSETRVERTLELSCAEVGDFAAGGRVEDDACVVLCRNRAHIEVTSASCEIMAPCGGDTALDSAPDTGDTADIAVVAACAGTVPSECY